MLIDDHFPTNVLHKLVIEELECANYIFDFTDPKKALEYLSQEYTEEKPKPTIIFLDINMPGMNGWEFLDAYRIIPEAQKSEIVLVMLSTSTHPDDIKKAERDKEVKDYIYKPLTKALMIEILEKYIS